TSQGSGPCLRSGVRASGPEGDVPVPPSRRRCRECARAPGSRRLPRWHEALHRCRPANGGRKSPPAGHIPGAQPRFRSASLHGGCAGRVWANGRLTTAPAFEWTRPEGRELTLYASTSAAPYSWWANASAINRGDAQLVLLCPEWNKHGSARTVK